MLLIIIIVVDTPPVKTEIIGAAEEASRPHDNGSRKKGEWFLGLLGSSAHWSDELADANNKMIG